MKKIYLLGIVMVGWSVVDWATDDGDKEGNKIVRAAVPQERIGSNSSDISCIGRCFSFNRRRCAYSCAAALLAFGLWAWSIYGPSRRIVG